LSGTNRFALLQGVVIAIDFDGTCVEHHYPETGPDVPGAEDTLRELQAAGAKLILWTMRSGDGLEKAKRWFHVRGILLYGVNRNPTQHWTQSPKAYAQIYVDDAALGCPLIPGVTDHPTKGGGPRPMVDWIKVGLLLAGGVPR